MQILDASAILYAWDNYPQSQFPGLWIWLAGQVKEHELVIPSVAFDEVGHKAPECAQWLKGMGVLRLPMTNKVVQAACKSSSRSVWWAISTIQRA